MKKIISLILIICISFSFGTALATTADEPQIGLTSWEKYTNRDYFYADLKKLTYFNIQKFCHGDTLRVKALKEAKDFAGNTYYVVEFDATGFLIFHGETGEIFEYSRTDPSPYRDVETDLFICGQKYYSLSGRYYRNTLREQKIFHISDTATLGALKKQSDYLHQNVMLHTYVRVVKGMGNSVESLNSFFKGKSISSDQTFDEFAGEIPTSDNYIYITPNNMLISVILTYRQWSGKKAEVSEIKELRDFADNIYFAIEFGDSGYLICHGETGEILEYSTTDPSPYLGLYPPFGYEDAKTDLFFLAPTYYFVLSDGAYKSIYYENEIIDSKNEQALVALKSYSDILNQNALNSSNNRVLSLTESYLCFTEDFVGNRNRDIAETYIPENSSADYQYVVNADGIQQLDTSAKMGYDYHKYNHTTNPLSVTGQCGYVAAGIILLWYDKLAQASLRNDSTILDFAYLYNSSALLSSGTALSMFRGGDGVGDVSNDFRRGGLSSKLYSYSLSDGLNAVGLSNTINSYFSETAKSASIIASSNVSFSSIYNRCTTAPVIIMTSITVEIDGEDVELLNHAMVAYGRSSDENLKKIVVHAGIEQQTNLTVTEQMNPLISGCVYIDGQITSGLSNYGNVPIWFEEAIDFCARNSIIKNRSTNDFNSSGQIPRGVFFNALYQIAGTPSISQPQEDTIINTYGASSVYPYLNAAAWGTNVEGYVNGVHYYLLNGVPGTSLGFNEALTREQAAVFLYRLASYLSFNTDLTIEGGADATTFSDWSIVDTWARAGMRWAVSHGILNGSSATTLNPLGILTRGEASQLIYNFYNQFREVRNDANHEPEY